MIGNLTIMKGMKSMNGNNHLTNMGKSRSFAATLSNGEQARVV